MIDADTAARALAEALGHDPTLASDAHRLRRALLDLLPDDDRDVELLLTGIHTGIPGLLAAGSLNEARLALADQAGLRTDVADRVASIWLRAISGQLVDDESWPTLPDPGFRPEPRSAFAPVATTQATDPAPASESPGTPSSVRLSLWPDGTGVLALLTASGVFAAIVPADLTTPAGGELRWRRMAQPRSAASRDLAVVRAHTEAQGGRRLLVWADESGIHGRDLRRDRRPSGPEELALARPRLLVPTSVADQPRYPLGMLMADPGTIDILWTTDRNRLRRSTLREWLPAAVDAQAPTACAADERLADLDVAVENDRTAWLVTLTDGIGSRPNSLKLSAWDLDLDDISAMASLNQPQPLAAVALVILAARPTVIAAGASGQLLSLDVRQAFAGDVSWHRVNQPLGTPRATRSIAVAADSIDGTARLVMVGDRGVWIAPLTRSDAGAVLGRALALRVAAD